MKKESIILPSPRFLVGLGNEGASYQKTHHNLGRWMLFELHQRLDFQPFRRQEGCWQATQYFEACAHSTTLLFPSGFMNLSGAPLARFLGKNWSSKGALMVLHDDLELPLGEIRLKFSGGHGGHNGLRSIIQSLSSADFWRLRIGIGRPQGDMSVASYVLSEPSHEAWGPLKKSLAPWIEDLTQKISKNESSSSLLFV